MPTTYTLNSTPLSDLPRCKRCAYYEPERYIDSDDEEGICRRHAPQPRFDPNANDNEWTYLPSNPIVLPYRDWCGDFISRATKSLSRATALSPHCKL